MTLTKTKRRARRKKSSIKKRPFIDDFRWSGAGHKRIRAYTSYRYKSCTSTSRPLPSPCLKIALRVKSSHKKEILKLATHASGQGYYNGKSNVTIQNHLSATVDTSKRDIQAVRHMAPTASKFVRQMSHFCPIELKKRTKYYTRLDVFTHSMHGELFPFNTPDGHIVVVPFYNGKHPVHRTLRHGKLEIPMVEGSAYIFPAGIMGPVCVPQLTDKQPTSSATMTLCIFCVEKRI